MKIAILTKSNHLEGLAKTKELSEYFNKNNIEFDCFETKNCFDTFKNNNYDAMVAFGGDGTTLKAVTLTSKHDLPILPVNIGDMGFLAELERSASPEKIMEYLKIGEIEKRAMIEVCGDNFENAIALNDIVVKSNEVTPVYINAKVNGEDIDTYRADGVIVSTPTGSTAYSLSAGGPILSPMINGLVINPICPHTLYSRPIVVPSENNIELVLAKEKEIATLIVDGRQVASIKTNDKICVYESKYTAKFLRKENKGFYKKLLQKMNVWGKINN